MITRKIKTEKKPITFSLLARLARIVRPAIGILCGVDEAGTTRSTSGYFNRLPACFLLAKVFSLGQLCRGTGCHKAGPRFGRCAASNNTTANTRQNINQNIKGRPPMPTLSRRDFATIASCALCSLTGFIATDASAQTPPAGGTPGVTRKILSQTDGPTP
jgi:hypothetical protein